MKKLLIATVLVAAAIGFTGCQCERGASWNPQDGYSSAGACYVPCIPGMTCTPAEDADPEDNGNGGDAFNNGGR